MPTSKTSRTLRLPPPNTEVRRVPLTELKPAPYNPRTELKPGDATFEKLRKSIETFGAVEPIVWNRRTGHVVGGHQRLAVLKHLGHERVDVVVVDLALQQEKALNLALNRITGDWDERKLASLIEDLVSDATFDPSLTGFDTAEIDHLVASASAHAGLSDDDAFNVGAHLRPREPAVTRPGELLVLGAHRLLCGDCTDAQDVQRVMDGRRAVLFATDPPYLVDYDGMNHPVTSSRKAQGTARTAPATSGPSRNKDWSGTYGVTWDDAAANPDLYDKFVGTAIAHAIMENAAWYCWHASRRQGMVEAVWQKHGAFVHCQIIWAKNRPVLTRSWYAWQHEPCFMGWIQGKKPPRAAREVRSTVWSIDTIPNGPERPDHPTPKPLEVFETPMLQHTKPGEVCYEPFAGSGSQVIAAEKLGRRCFALEISPHYCDVIVRRWIHLVGPARAPRDLVKRYALPPDSPATGNSKLERSSGSARRAAAAASPPQTTAESPLPARRTPRKAVQP